jgi:hypothetical protein
MLLDYRRVERGRILRIEGAPMRRLSAHFGIRRGAIPLSREWRRSGARKGRLTWMAQIWSIQFCHWRANWLSPLIAEAVGRGHAGIFSRRLGTKLPAPPCLVAERDFN